VFDVVIFLYFQCDDDLKYDGTVRRWIKKRKEYEIELDDGDF
jgi:hypothetical protein